MFLKTLTTTGFMLLLTLFVTPFLLGVQTQQKVDLNQADQKSLETLPGIGSTTAQRILEYREENGRFKRIEELMNVWGIGEKKFEKLKEKITVTAAVPKKTDPQKKEPVKEDPE